MVQIMANFFDETWMNCPQCKCGVFYERPLYSYKKEQDRVTKKDLTVSVLVGIQLVCRQCGKVVETYNKDNQGQLVAISATDQMVRFQKYKIT